MKSLSDKSRFLDRIVRFLSDLNMAAWIKLVLAIPVIGRCDWELSTLIMAKKCIGTIQSADKYKSLDFLDIGWFLSLTP